MITPETIIQISLICVVLTVAIISITKSLSVLIRGYAIQSLILSVICVVLYTETKNATLLWLCAITILSKVLLIPVVISKLQNKMKLHRELKFHYLSPVGSIFASIAIVLLTYSILSNILEPLNLTKIGIFGTAMGLSLALIGMLIIASRKRMITKIVGYLTMENGVLLLSLFVAELPFIIEILMMLDLVMLSVIATLLVFGIDTSIDEFHEKLKNVPANSISHVEKTTKNIHREINKIQKKYLRVRK